MEKVLYFVSNYNAQIIQVGFAIVFILIIAYVYRSFFMSGGMGADSVDVAHSPAIEQKLNQILEIQKSRSANGSQAPHAADSSAASPLHTDEEVDKLKAEIYNLRQQLVETEKNISLRAASGSSIASSAGNSNDAMSAAGSTGNDSGSAAAVDPTTAQAAEEMVVKVKELESRLAEYEIIADDIAELSQLRSENTRLKEQLSNFQGTSTASTEIPDPDQIKTETEATPPAEATVTNEAIKEVMASPAVTSNLSGQEAIDALFAAAMADIPDDAKKKEDQ